MNRKLLKKLALIITVISMFSASMTAFAAETYTVQSGDSLKKIAGQVYGDEAKWETIYEANKASIKNPNIIYKGQVFAIPGAENTDAAQETTEDAAVTGTENANEAEEMAAAPVKNLPVGENPVVANDWPVYAAVETAWKYTLASGYSVTVDGGDYVADATDVYGITYREYEQGRNAEAMKIVAEYVAENPDSNFANMVKQNGNRFVIITSEYSRIRRDFDDEYFIWFYDYVDCEPEDCVYMFVCGDYFEDFDASDDISVSELFAGMFESVSENIHIS